MNRAESRYAIEIRVEIFIYGTDDFIDGRRQIVPSSPPFPSFPPIFLPYTRTRRVMRIARGKGIIVLDYFMGTMSERIKVKNQSRDYRQYVPYRGTNYDRVAFVPGTPELFQRGCAFPAGMRQTLRPVHESSSSHRFTPPLSLFLFRLVDNIPRLSVGIESG